MNLEETIEREKAARSHGRHIKLEEDLNAIGLSLLAPPFTGFREVKGNEWEGHFIPEHRTKLEQIIDDLANELFEISALAPGAIAQEHCSNAANKITELVLFIRTVNAEGNKKMSSNTDQNSKAVSPEEVDRWIDQFSTYCEAQKIEMEANNKEFIALERAYWMGIISGRGAEAIPPGLQMILFAYRSPLLEYKSPLKKRMRRTKAQMEAEQGHAQAQVETPTGTDATL